MMTPRRLGWTLRARGPALDAWPAADRDAALALLRQSPEARQLLADTLADDDDDEADPVGLARMQSVVHRALSPPPPVLRGIRWTAMAACLVAGLYVGLASGVEASVADAALESGTSATVLAALDP